jgi:predicted metal-binding membrane protein
MTHRARAVATTIAAVRLGAGVALGASPQMFLRWEPPIAGTSMPLLLRTVGIRDLAVGVGTAAALLTSSGGDFRAWIAAGLLSDTCDVVAGIAGSRTTGIRALSSALIAAPMVVAGVYVLATAKHDET